MNDGYIYFFQTIGLETPMVKIGFTYQDVNKRYREVSGQSPLPLSILGFIKGSHKKEKWLHRLFDEDKVHHEWFTLSDRLEGYVGTMHDVDGEHKLNEKMYEHINSELYDGSTKLSDDEVKVLVGKLRHCYENKSCDEPTGDVTKQTGENDAH